VVLPPGISRPSPARARTVTAAMLQGVAPGMLPGDYVDTDACSTQIGHSRRGGMHTKDPGGVLRRGEGLGVFT
jgi:hypothetical protein